MSHLRLLRAFPTWRTLTSTPLLRQTRVCNLKLRKTTRNLQHFPHLNRLDSPQILNLEEIAGMDNDDYGFSSSDEAGMAQLTSITEPGTTTNRKRSGEPVLLAPKKIKLLTPQYPTTSTLARRILKETWGYPTFRLRQEEVISRLIHGGSAVVVFPTGGGKSLIYQIPALAFDEFEKEIDDPRREGLTLVVSPLIALMKDQVDALQARGVKAAAIDSSQSREGVLHTYDLLRRRELKILYCAPERLNNEGFVETVKHTRIRLIAIDEAHCISEWGQAFRPDYLKIARFAKEIKAERVLCLTATATPRVSADICAGFDIPEDGLFKTTTYRENLQLFAESFRTTNDKMPRLKEFLKENPGATIVYVTTHQQTEDVAAALTKHGLCALPYHAGMNSKKRMEVQDRFMKEKNITIIATIAFGMGIDKPDIRNIVHYDFPRSLEGYSQEIGRAGRDSLPSKCILFLCGDDWNRREMFCRADLPAKKSVRELLNDLFAENAASGAGDCVEQNLNDQSKHYDVKLNALNLLYAQLELRFELLRAITPKYSNYTYKRSPSFESSTETDGSPIALSLKSLSTGKLNKKVDVDSVSVAAKVKREDVVRKLQDWNDKGFIELSPSRVVNRYCMIKPFPRGTEAKKLIDLAYEQMEAREIEDLKRSKQVIELITSEKCFAIALASHFGDEVPQGRCGGCTFCLTGIKVEMVEGKNMKVIIDERKIQAVLEACSIRDDPRLLAKIAFGISSPRITTEKCGAKSPVFGSMANCDFNALVKMFAGYCDKDGEE